MSGLSPHCWAHGPVHVHSRPHTHLLTHAHTVAHACTRNHTQSHTLAHTHGRALLKGGVRARRVGPARGPLVPPAGALSCALRRIKSSGEKTALGERPGQRGRWPWTWWRRPAGRARGQGQAGRWLVPLSGGGPPPEPGGQGSLRGLPALRGGAPGVARGAPLVREGRGRRWLDAGGWSKVRRWPPPRPWGAGAPCGWAEGVGNEGSSEFLRLH